MNKEKLGKNAIFLIASDLIYTITALFAETFLVAYLLKITNDNITQVSLYYMIINLIHAMGSMFIGKFIKDNKYSKTKILSLGITIRAIFILFIVLLGNNLSNMFIIVAIFCGISETLYWSTHEMIFVTITNNSNRKSYMATKKITSTIVNIVAPIILGSTIELYSFTKIAIYVFALSIIQIILSLQIKIDEQANIETTKFSIKNYIDTIKLKKDLKVHKYYKSNLLYGIVEDPMRTLVTIITMMTFKTSLNLGILTTIFSIFQIVVMYLYKKFYNKNNAKYILFAVSSLIFVGAIGLVIDIRKITLVIYNFACTTGLCIFDAIYNTQKGDLIKECNIEEYDVEHVMLNSVLTCLSRFTGFVLILIVGLIDNMIVFKGLLAVMAIFILIYSRIIANIEREDEMIKYIILSYNPDRADKKDFHDWKDYNCYRCKSKFSHDYIPAGSKVLFVKNGYLLGGFTVVRYEKIEKPKNDNEWLLYKKLTDYPMSLYTISIDELKESFTSGHIFYEDFFEIKNIEVEWKKYTQKQKLSNDGRIYITKEEYDNIVGASRMST